MTRIPARWWLPLVLAGCLTGGVLLVLVASAERNDPLRCAEGLVALGPYCCGEGQSLEGHRCVGTPARCAEGMDRQGSGCVLTPLRVFVPGGTLTVGPLDWEAEGVVEPRRVRLAAFEIDRGEVTVARFQACVVAGQCPTLTHATELGEPVRGISASAAERFCRTEGGRLPSEDEWLFAAMGAQGRRYPWGSTGLVCRRAAFGLVEGPCARGAVRPDLTGARRAGATSEGILDLAGNVAEWTRTGERTFQARGGSFRSRRAQELKSWAKSGPPRRAEVEADLSVGFRCAYDP